MKHTYVSGLHPSGVVGSVAPSCTPWLIQYQFSSPSGNDLNSIELCVESVYPAFVHGSAELAAAPHTGASPFAT